MPNFESTTKLTQRRYLTVLFSDLSGSSELAESLEAEDLSAILQLMRDIARDVIPRHGGRIARIQGDGLLAIFGYPQAMEDDGRRGCEAALDLHLAIAQLPMPKGLQGQKLHMHSGIHSGLVLLTEGDIERGRFDIVGEVPNTAARLCTVAGTDEICVSTETLGPQSHFFQHSVPKIMDVRGRAAPMMVTLVAGRSTINRRFDAAAMGGFSAFVGRLDTLARLHQLLRKSLEGEATALVLVGEAGIGKTRLLDEFQRQIDRQRVEVLHGYCERYLNAEPLQAFLQVVRLALGWRLGSSNQEFLDIASAKLTALGAEWPLQMAPLVNSLLFDQAGIERARGVVADPGLISNFIRALAQKGPLLLVLDDWQWADDASQSALHLVLSLRLPIMVLVAARPVGLSEDVAFGLPVLNLPAFADQESAVAISDMLPNANPFLIQEIQNQSGGSPLFIEELCHSIAAGGSLAKPEWRNGRAAWINALVASRVGRLPQEEANLLQFASVIGNAFSCRLLEQLTGHGENSALVNALTAHDFLFPATHSGMLRFKHTLTRDAVYATVDPYKRKSLHVQVAEFLRGNPDQGESRDWFEALTYHCEAGGLHRAAAHYAELSGDKALSAQALDSARRHFVVALQALDQLPSLDKAEQIQWCNLAQKLGYACVFDPLDLPNGMAFFERAAQFACALGDSNLIARAKFCLAYMTHAQGKLRDAQRFSEEALAIARQTDDVRLAANVAAILGQIYVAAGSYDQAQPMIIEANTLKAQNGNSGARASFASAYFLAGKAYMLGDKGQFELAHACFAESLAMFADRVHPTGASIWALRSGVFIWQGQWAEAIDAAKKAGDFALRCRTRSLTAMSRALVAGATWMSTKEDSAFTELRVATQWIEDAGGAVYNSLNYGWLVHMSVDRGDEVSARHFAARLFQHSRQLDRHGVAMGRRALARLAIKKGDLVAAYGHLSKAKTNADLRDSAHERACNLVTLAEWTFNFGQHSEASRLLEDACAQFESLGMRWHLDGAIKQLAHLRSN